MPASPAQNHNPNFLDFVPRARVLIYEGTTNIGDAIQTVAIARLLGGVCAGVYRDSPIPRLHDDVPFVVNGWLGRGTPVNGANCIFAGVHLGHRESGYIRWIRESTNPVGARDEYTKGLLASNGIPSEMVACATLTFPRYLGPRRGRYSVDVEPVPGSAFESSIIANLPWAEQWELALHRLDQLRKAELVYTRRLHVILPCLAFGTPVVFPSNEFRDLFDKSRLGLLHDIGFVYDEAVEMDVAPLADRFVRFLENALNTSLNPVDHPSMPIPITPRDSGEHDGLPSAGQLTAVREGCAPPAAVELSARSGRAQPMVSAVVLTKNGAGRIERCLESIAASGLASEIVVCVDRSTTDATMSIAGRYTQHVHLLETRGFIEPSLPEMVSLCSGQFILRLDDDECLGGEWGGLWLQALSRFNDLTHFLTPCRWVVPPGDRFIASPPWFPDFRVRVFRNKPALISWPDQIHDKMTIAGRGLALVDRWIDHYVLVDRSRSEREAKCRYYQSLRPAKHLSHCYLWEDQEVILSSTDDRGYAAAVERALPAQTPADVRSPRPYETGSEIRFDVDGNSGDYTLSGWSKPEPWGTWTDGYRAELGLLLQENKGFPATLTVEANAYVRPGHACLRVFVVCGHKVIGEWTIETPDVFQRTLTISDSVIAGSNHVLRVAFHIANPASPKELGESGDGRLLGLGFRSLRLTKIGTGE